MGTDYFFETWITTEYFLWEKEHNLYKHYTFGSLNPITDEPHV